MKSGLIILSIAGCFIGSCKKDNDRISYLKAKVIQTSDISCYLPLLDFTEDSVRIHNLTPVNGIKFTVIKLPQDFNILNKKLYVSVTTLDPKEEFPCNTLGIIYPRLKILDVKER